MKRRKFVKKAATMAVGAIGMPYILPSGRLFAKTNVTLADHVVLILFAGGVRQQESILKRYLADSQSLPYEGNIMYNLLNGTPPTQKIVYGTTTPGGAEGGQPIAPVLETSLQSQGTLFSEVQYSAGSTGHFQGLSTGVSGHYGITQGLRQRPVHPTIFEYVRRFRGAAATDTWFVGNGISNSIPLLNYSAHPNFGADYGANFFAPTVTFSERGETWLKDAKIYHPEEELSPIEEMRYFLNQNFLSTGQTLPSIKNTEAERESIKVFMKQVFDRKQNAEIALPPVFDNGDLQTMGYATEVLRYFRPTLTIINMNDIDACHSSYTDYLQALHRADHATGFLWKYIQEQIPEMADNTVLMAMPEHGRNYEHNGILDQNDWRAFDHDSDANSRRIWSIMVGAGVEAGLQVGSEGNPVGDAADIVPTIAEILGIKNDVMNTGLLHNGAMSLFDRI